MEATQPSLAPNESAFLHCHSQHPQSRCAPRLAATKNPFPRGSVAQGLIRQENYIKLGAGGKWAHSSIARAITRDTLSMGAPNETAA